MATRLDRLFLLLDNGGSSATRKAAAVQLGEVVRLHPNEYETLLDRLHAYIASKSWETRIAAAQAVEAIVSNMPPWDPQPISNDDDEMEDSLVSDGHLSLKSFNITNILHKGPSLLSDDGSQFELDEEFANQDPREKAAQLRLLVNKKLGLVGVDDTDSIISLNDLTHVPENINKDTSPKESVVQIVQSEMVSAGITLSSRELNRAKRKAKFLNKQKSTEPSDKATEGCSDRKKQKLVHQDNCKVEEDADNCLTIVEDKCVPDQTLEWPLEDFTDQLCRDLFSSSWEIRHGAATAIREVIRLQGRGSGKAANMTARQMAVAHEKWLEDKAVRLVCVLALDRFGDFLADQVVAPVRETCAQVLGGLVHLLPERIVMDILYLLQDMLVWHEWGTRHGGLLGLKYILAVRVDIRIKLLTMAYDRIFKGLQDEMDDVVAVAATCLVPVAEDLVECLPKEILNNLLTTLWDALLDIDDLTSSTNSILHLLAKLLGCQKIKENIPGNLDELIPRIWPFLSHSSCSVRLSALKTIETLTAPIKNCNSHKTNYNGIFESNDSHLQIKGNGNVEGMQECNNGDCSMAVTDSLEKTESLKEFKKTSWMEKVLESLLVHTYQRALLENNRETILLVIQIWKNIIENVPLANLLIVSCRYLPSWLVLLMANPKVPLDHNLLIYAQHSKGNNHKKRSAGELGESVSKLPAKLFIGGTNGNLEDCHALSDIAQARRVAGILLGNLSHYVSQPMPGIEYKPDETPILCYIRLLLSHLNSNSGIQRLGAGLVSREWALQHPKTLCHSLLKTSLLSGVSDAIYYDEITWSFTRLQQETKDFIAMLRHYKIEVNSEFSDSIILTLGEIKVLCDSVKNDMSKLRKKVFETLESRRKEILRSVSQTSGDQVKLNTMIQSVLAGALVRFKCLPEKLNPVIRPLMDSIKREVDEEQQKMAAADLTALLELCLDRVPCPNIKVIKNLASFLCVDEDFTPNILNNPFEESLKDGIMSISTQEKCSSVTLLRRNSSTSGRGPGRPPLKPVVSNAVEIPMISNEATENMEIKKQNEIQRRGCTFALKSITSYFGPKIEAELPYMLNMIFDPLSSPKEPESVETVQNIINWLQFLEVVVPTLDSSIVKKFDTYLPVLDSLLLCNSFSSIRHMTSRVFATLATVAPLSVMPYIIENIVTGFNDVSSTLRRQGAVECVHLTIEKLAFKIVPYVVFLIVPLLGRMSDHDEAVRVLATQCFATLIRLYPLDGGTSSMGELSQQLLLRREKERLFLDRLLDPKKIEDYKIPVPIKAELRSYQQKGVNWMAFLNQYNLHGILCDDMGLGKTLQSICILAGDHFIKEKLFKESKEPSKVHPCKTGVQSLVVCPPTLTGHWCYEINRFVSTKHLNPLHYTGPPMDRKRLRDYFPDHNLIVASYKIIRNEIDFFSQTHWNYIILDEGHMIKNGKTKASKAIKELIGNHRLILSGTPIQNNVLELWSLFDFLMPGFLGTERQFMSKYARPILQSRDPKSSGKDQEAGALAMEALHRQALPFLLRRVKEDVLKDLPPKITQDYFCELSPLQERLYEDFARSRACQNLDETLKSNEDKVKAPGSHIFQALQYLRRVCNHPKLALLPSHPQYERINLEISRSKLPLSDISHSAKLPALKQLLLDCGIGTEEIVGITNAVVSPHRALIFCQLKAMLDIIENDLFRVHLPRVTYLRLDGSVPAGSRHSLVQRFNSDPSIDVLLLTTQVGGLGLNLTGADTVIFVEHDWNPMRDLQAMDRAHRIGQKNVVNVYRLITIGTLEEKIMSLQKFKMMTANSVISHENSSLLSMGTEQLLDLFTLDAKGNLADSDSADKKNASSASSDTLGLSGIKGIRIKEVIENLPEMWDESVYENEYNLDNFMASLK